MATAQFASVRSSSALNQASSLDVGIGCAASAATVNSRPARIHRAGWYMTRGYATAKRKCRRVVAESAVLAASRNARIFLETGVLQPGWQLVDGDRLVVVARPGRRLGQLRL